MRRLGNCYYNNVAESLFTYKRVGGLKGKPKLSVRKHTKMHSVIFNYYKTQNEIIARMLSCRQKKISNRKN